MISSTHALFRLLIALQLLPRRFNMRIVFPVRGAIELKKLAQVLSVSMDPQVCCMLSVF